MATDVEEFWIAALNSNLELIDKKLLFRGTVNSCLVHPRDIIRFTCIHNAVSFVIAHNHPSGNPRRPETDLIITKKLFQLGCLLEIPMNDHLILSSRGYFSFADAGLLLKYKMLKSMRLRP